MRDVSAIQIDVLRLAAQAAHLRADCLDLQVELNRDHLPRGPEYDRMANEKVAPSLAYHLAGRLGVLDDDYLIEVESQLRDAAERTAVSLADEFEKEKERRT